MQVDPIKLTLKASGTKHLKMKYVKLHSSVCFNFNLSRYTKAASPVVAAAAASPAAAAAAITAATAAAAAAAFVKDYCGRAGIKQDAHDEKQTEEQATVDLVGRCRLTQSNPYRNRPDICSCFQHLLTNSTCGATTRRWRFAPRRSACARRQGIPLVHIYAQPEPFLSLKPAKHSTTWERKCSR